MRLVTDLHVHSKYARATSKLNNLDAFAAWCPRKGIDVLGTGDFTHPFYFKEIQSKLEEIKDTGLYKLKGSDSPLRFMLTSEISLIWTQDKKVRKSHLLIFAPNIETVAKLGAMFSKIGNTNADGRPIFGLSARDAAARVLEVNSDCFIIPAHAWTPWFSVFGSNSGFDSLDECFGDMREHIQAIETGLSSDPEMNWRISALDSVALVSYGDAHSLPNLMREATIYELQEPTFNDIIEATKNSSPNNLRKNPKKKIDYTIEFFPEEGKYHLDGHLACGVVLEPEESLKRNNICPVCGKGLTVGVLHRINALSDRKTGERPDKVVPYKSLVQLDQIIGEAWGVGEKSKKVVTEYNRLIDELESEFKILIDHPISAIAKIADARVVDGIERVRAGDIAIEPGYDGQYGKVNVFSEKKNIKQVGLF
jgi:uncharacterized protein (TIGR00375 family)